MNAQAIVNIIKHHLLRNPNDAHLFVHAAKPNTESNIAIPTWEMRQTGKAIIEALQVHQFNLRLYGLGEAKTLEDWIPDNVPNKDLIVGYLQNKLDTPTCVYLAMQRAKVAA